MGAETKGDRLRGGFAVKHTPGPWLFAAAVSDGFGWYDSLRPIELPGFTTVATGDHKVWNVTRQLRVARQIDVGPTYFKPRLDLAVSHLGFSRFEEDGGPKALSVRSMDDTVFSASPTLEWGAELGTLAGTLCDGACDRLVRRRQRRLRVVPWHARRIAVHRQQEHGSAHGRCRCRRGAANSRRGIAPCGLFGSFSSDLELHSLGLRGSVPF